MGLGVTLGNALSGMHGSQAGLDVLSRNVANSGTPGYHRQSVSSIQGEGSNSTYARTGQVQRAFVQSLQTQYNDSLTSSAASSVRADFLSRLETYLGMPGDANSLDTQYGNFENALQALTTSPDDYTARAEVIATAESLAGSLNSLTGAVQDLRRETESEITENVERFNRNVTSLREINLKLADQSITEGSRAALLDERDRLVGDISGIVDVRATYRADDTVALMTKSGLGLLDVETSRMSFESAGSLSATSQFSVDGDGGVGKLTLRTPAGSTIDLVQQGVLQSGSLGALVKLRDETLPEMQGQLDEIAAGLAQSLSSVETSGSAVTSGAQEGFELDAGNLEPGNSITLSYTESGVEKTVRVVRVDDTSKLPMDYTGSDGARVVGIDFSSGVASAATDLDAILGTGLNVSNPAGDTLRILDDGAGGTTDIASMTAMTTVTGTQGEGPGLNLFVDNGNSPFTNSLDGDPQKRGFAGRISVNRAIVADNTLLVKDQAGTALGDNARPSYLLDQIKSAQFTTDSVTAPELGNFRLSGNVQGLISQTLNYQGSSIAQAQSAQETQQQSMQALETRMDVEYGVNIDEEMARLMELQNAYAANARVVNIVQELLDRLMQI